MLLRAGRFRLRVIRHFRELGRVFSARFLREMVAIKFATQARALSIINSQVPLDFRMSSIASRIAPRPAKAFVV